MNFNTHFDLVGRHAFLSASKYHWLRYDEDKIAVNYRTSMAAAFGTRLHALAAELITVGMRMPRNSMTFNQYVNDAIGFKMKPEQPLFYSDVCFGTPDAISFRRNMLRIHDLKTGTSKASFDQLKIYAAMFCLEYRFKPAEIEMEFRIYQNDEVLILEGDPDEITHIMSKIVQYDKIIQLLKEEEL